jgi:hypothetical protein
MVFILDQILLKLRLLLVGLVTYWAAGLSGVVRIVLDGRGIEYKIE